jgi:aminopeptidase N
MAKDSVVEFGFEYQGDKVVSKEGGGNFAVGARESWYPNVNAFHDHARFDLTFRVPKAYTLVSVGKQVKEWTEKDIACSQWVSEIPLAVAGFNYGTFKKKTITDSVLGITIEGYATTEAPDYIREMRESTTGNMAPSALMEGTLIEAQNSLRVYSNWFGKSEFDRIAITQQPQFGFGQSWPSLVYLPMLAYLDSTQRFKLLGINNKVTAFVNEVTAHEVAHQYWGHMVGWSSYHDQWLSEGFSNFSAGLYLQYTRKGVEPYLQYWEQARKAILEKNRFGRRPNDAGPIWMGVRLSSEKNPSAYDTVVYDKGGYVLHMLRQLMYDHQEKDKPFAMMIQDFVRRHLNKNASTESFQRIVEKHMRPNMNLTGDGKMDWFFKQWVYGTAIPKYKLDYSVTEEGGKLMLKGSVTQSEVPADFMMMVPIYLDFDGQLARMGAARMTGNTTLPINVELPKKPKRVLLNYFHDVLEQ